MNSIEYATFFEESARGENYPNELNHYVPLNLHRHQRWMKHGVISDSLQEQISKITTIQHWVLITEPWCGDAAQCVPALEKLALCSPNIQTKYILRDENPEVMDAYLTNGGRSIPKLICLDEQLQEVFTWGPRPDVIQAVMNDLKANGVTEIAQIVEAIQKAYNDNKQAGIYDELAAVLNSI